MLTGVIAALLAQGLDAVRAAAAGVWLHAPPAAIAARAVGAPEGVIASDVIAALPARARAEGRRPMTSRAAHSRVSDVERDRAQLRAAALRAARRRELCAVVKADGYGHGAVAERARAALAGGRELAGGRQRRRGAGAASTSGLDDAPCS